MSPRGGAPGQQPPAVGKVDFTHGASVAWWHAALNSTAAWGAAAFEADGGVGTEFVSPGTPGSAPRGSEVFADGTPLAVMHNRQVG